MIELQVLNYIIKNHDGEFLSTYSDKFFPNYKKEYAFIKKHFTDYKSIPDIETVVGEFNEFGVIDVTEPKKYLENKLVEEYTFQKAIPVIESSQDMFKDDARGAVEYIIRHLSEIDTPRKDFGKDIIKSASERYDVFLDKFNSVETDDYEFSTGLKELDLLIGGLRRGEELLVIYARTNNAKTWIAELIAVAVWAAKHNVGFFSPEMSDTEIGYRFDTLFKHFSSMGMSGRERDFDADKYSSYIKKLQKYDNIFNVTSPLDFNKDTTVSKLGKWIDDQKLDMIVIDGISYLTNERGNNKKETDRLTEIAEDLMLLSKEKKIPVIAVMQANRTAARDANGEVNDDTPELDTIRNSDGISHNASRAIAVRYKNNNLTLKITKDRYSDSVGSKLIYNVDLNTGKFTYVPNPKANLPDGENERIAEENRKQFETDSEEMF